MGNQFNRQRVVTEHWSQEIDWSHPSAQGLVYALRFDAQNASTRTAANRQTLARECRSNRVADSQNSSITKTKTPLGSGLSLTGTPTSFPVQFGQGTEQRKLLAVSKHGNWVRNSPFSFFTWREMSSETSSPFFGIGYTAANDKWGWGWKPSSDRYDSWVEDFQANSTVGAYTRTAAAGAAFSSAAVRKLSSPFLGCWVDGRRTANYAHLGAIGSLGTAGPLNQLIWGADTSYSNYLKGFLGVGYVWRRDLTNSEAQSLFADPMQLFIDRRKPNLGIAGVGAAGGVLTHPGMTARMQELTGGIHG